MSETYPGTNGSPLKNAMNNHFPILAEQTQQVKENTFPLVGTKSLQPLGYSRSGAYDYTTKIIYYKRWSNRVSNTQNTYCAISVIEMDCL